MAKALLAWRQVTRVSVCSSAASCRSVIAARSSKAKRLSLK